MAARDEVLEQLRQKIRGHLNERADHMAEGSCKNFPEYTHQTGVIEGLALAERELLDIDQRLYIDDTP
jgi:hypothetical protein